VVPLVLRSWITAQKVVAFHEEYLTGIASPGALQNDAEFQDNFHPDVGPEHRLRLTAGNHSADHANA
jgi:hypothetical protein